MSVHVKILGLLVLTAVSWTRVAGGRESLMEVSLERDAIFTPGQLRITVRLTDRATLAGLYQAKAVVSLAGIVVREQTLNVRQEAPAVLAVPFPKVAARSEVRCRVELSRAEEFLEAGEYPVSLWPPAAPLGPSERPTNVWVLDTSGGLQRMFHDMEISVADAAFQGIRDFALPSVVFLGEFSDVKVMRLIRARLAQAPGRPVTVFLRQREFPPELEIEMVGDRARGRSVTCDMKTPLLKDLTQRDLMSLTGPAQDVKLKYVEGLRRLCVVTTPDREAVDVTGTYLATITDASHLDVFCQLPVMDPCDPRQVTLLRNLVRLAAQETTRSNRDENPSSERKIP
jgi:hypothetical protein